MDRTLTFISKYLEHNRVGPKDLPALIEEVYNRINDKPHVPIEDTINDDYLICLEDMKKVVLLKRHLNQHFGMTLDEYREKWGLPGNYPVVPRNYAIKRSRIAKAQGLGRKVSIVA